MRRREFITLFSSVAVSWPLAAHAQQGERIRRIGVLMGPKAIDPEGQKQATALQSAFEELGWLSGRNIEIQFRWHGGDAEKARALANRTYRSPSRLGCGCRNALAVRRSTGDTDNSNLVCQRRRSCGSGLRAKPRPTRREHHRVWARGTSMGAKWVQLLTEIAPRTTSISVMFNPASAPFARMFLPSMETSRRSIELQVSPVSNDAEIEQAIVAAGKRSPAGLIVLPDIFLLFHRDRLSHWRRNIDVPAIYALPAFSASAGC